MAWLSEAGCSMFEQSGDDLHAFAQESDLDPNELSDIQSKMEPLGLEQWQVNEVEEENWNAQWEADYPEVEIEALIRAKLLDSGADAESEDKDDNVTPISG